MAMNVGSSGGSGEPEVMMDINTTPLIDVMLVLIIMLIITIPVQLHSRQPQHAGRHAAAADEGAGRRHDRHRLRRHGALERRGGARSRRARGAARRAPRRSRTSRRSTSGRTSSSNTSRSRRCWPRRSASASPSSEWSAMNSSSSRRVRGALAARGGRGRLAARRGGAVAQESLRPEVGKPLQAAAGPDQGRPLSRGAGQGARSRSGRRAQRQRDLPDRAHAHRRGVGRRRCRHGGAARSRRSAARAASPAPTSCA